MSQVNFKLKAVKVGKTLAAFALAILVAQGVMMVTADEAQADGTCFNSSNICGLNGHNYSNHTFQGPPPN
ncbi:MAG: hypothetical protein JWR38_2841 [Mucilaginibacter sp.]|nr:hypothetical protein [Mucilaginibacter sp.]